MRASEVEADPGLQGVAGSPKVFLIGDDGEHLNLLQAMITEGVVLRRITVSLPVQKHLDPAEAIVNLPVHEDVIVLLDFQLSDGTALGWLTEIVRRDAGPVILVTTEGGEHAIGGASDYLTKSQIAQNPEFLYTAIRQAMRRYKLDLRNRELTGRLKEMNQMLERRAEHLRQLTETAHRFVDDVAHEFRNPLAVIQMFASNIEDGLGGPVTDQQKDFLGYIGIATRDLSQLIDDFLDSSRLKKGMLRVDRRVHRLEDLMKLVRAPLDARAHTRGVTLLEMLDSDLPAVFCDLEKTSRVLVNLAINAIKFSPDGGEIQIGAQRCGRGGVKVWVRDHGPGIDQGELAQVRARFGQASQGNSSIKGFGLGLSIADDLVRLNFGRMEIESKRGTGSTFSFTLCEDETEQIVRRFVEAHRERQGDPVISVLRAAPLVPDYGMERIQEFLATICFPMDLLLPLPEAGAILLFGDCDNPGDWVARLHGEWKGRNPESRRSAPFTLYPVGTWRGDEAERAILRCVLNQMPGRPQPVE